MSKALLNRWREEHGIASPMPPPKHEAGPVLPLSPLQKLANALGANAAGADWCVPTLAR